MPFLSSFPSVAVLRNYDSFYKIRSSSQIFFRKKIKIAAKRLKNQRFTAICVYYIIVPVLKTRTVRHFSSHLRLFAYKRRYALLRQVSETVEPPFSVCQVQHHFVNVKAFYLLLLTLYYRASSAYIIIFSDVKHSWRNYCFHNAHSLRSTVSAVC